MTAHVMCCESCSAKAELDVYHAAPNSMQSHGWVRLKKKTCWLYFCSECWGDLMRRVGRGKFLL